MKAKTVKQIAGKMLKKTAKLFQKQKETGKASAKTTAPPLRKQKTADISAELSVSGQMEQTLPQKSKKNNSLHDLFFREVYSKEKYSLDIFRLTLSRRQFALFNWTTLKSEMTSFISSDGREKRTDLAFSVKAKGTGQIARMVFIFEHKSYQPKDIHQQLLEYQTSAYSRWKDPVVPIVIYSGKRKEWEPARDFQESLRGLPVALKRSFRRDILNFRYKLLNIRKLNMRGLAGRLTTRPILHILKSVWGLDERVVEDLFQLGEDLDPADQEYLIKQAVLYIRRYDSRFNWQVLGKIEEKVLKEGRVMSLWQDALDEARQEGWQKGRQEERQKGQQEGWQKGQQEGWQKGQQKERQKVILNMLQAKADIAFISKVTGQPEEEIRKLENSAEK